MNKTLIACAFMLTGCAGVENVIERGAQANDSAVKSAEFVICQGASVGSIRRAYGTEDRAALWRELCATGTHFTPEPNE